MLMLRREPSFDTPMLFPRGPRLAEAERLTPGPGSVIPPPLVNEGNASDYWAIEFWWRPWALRGI